MQMIKESRQQLREIISAENVGSATYRWPNVQVVHTV